MYLSTFTHHIHHSNYHPNHPHHHYYRHHRQHNANNNYKVGINNPINDNGKADDSKPFYLYKGLNPEREEALKVYPNSLNIYPMSSSQSSSSSSSSAHSSSSFSMPLTNKNDRNSFSSNSEDEHDQDKYNNESVTVIHPALGSDEKIKFKCNYPDCRYKGEFLSRDYLRRHIREQHKRSREHVCLGYKSNGEKWGCNKKFSRPYQLVNHWRGQRSLKRCGVPEYELRKNGVL
jgi:hypothetical protein